MIKRIKQTLAVLAASLVAPTLAFVPVVRAEGATLVVTEANKQGWVFNPDLANATPYNFTEDESSLGAGSLYVQPIGATSAHKFIARKVLNTPAESLEAVSFDFQIAGDATKEEQFYLNVYVNRPGSTTFYDCRFDAVATVGSNSSFSTVNYLATDNVSVDDRFDGDPRPDDGYNCPTSLATMAVEQPGSTVSFMSLNLGDTSASDVGLGGYFDNVEVTVNGNTTVYDFELNEPPVVLTNKEQCKNGGWMTSELPVFRNQGACVSYFAVSGNPKAFANNPKF